MGNRAIEWLRYKAKSQISLEFTLSLIALLLFLGGIMRIWLWGTAQFAGRVPCYNKTRVKAASYSDTIGKWPIYSPRRLSEDIVFGKSGQYQGKALSSGLSLEEKSQRQLFKRRQLEKEFSKVSGFEEEFGGNNSQQAD